jgi:hypothetical protein
VLDVVALKTMKMRGQAHIVFRDIHASTQAMRSLQGFEFFGKEMVRGESFFFLATALLSASRTLLGIARADTQNRPNSAHRIRKDKS